MNRVKIIAFMGCLVAQVTAMHHLTRLTVNRPRLASHLSTLATNDTARGIAGGILGAGAGAASVSGLSFSAASAFNTYGTLTNGHQISALKLAKETAPDGMLPGSLLGAGILGGPKAMVLWICVVGPLAVMRKYMQERKYNKTQLERRLSLPK